MWRVKNTTGAIKMLKKVSVIFSVLSLSLILANCSAGKINSSSLSTVAEKTAKARAAFEEATINLNNVDSEEIDEVQVDGKTLSTKDYSSDNNQLNFSNLEPGKHIVKFKHKKYGYTDVPIDVRSDTENNYQLNAVIEGDAINDWELGIDANKDGIIDNDSFLSRQVDGYVVVREFSGTTNYLPKQNFAEDFRGEKVYPDKPPDFQFPETIGPQPGRGQKPVFMPQDPNQHDRSGQILNVPMMRSPKQDMLAPAKVYIPFPEKLVSFKINAIFIGDRLLPENGYLKENDSLILKGEMLRGNNGVIKVYLIDETGQGVLLSINPKRPIFNENNQVNREIFLGEEDLDYSLENNIKIEPERIEQLRHDLQVGIKIPPNKLPFQPGRTTANRAPNGKVLPLPFPKEVGNVAMGSGTGNKFVKIDENGEIVEYTDTVPDENQQDVSLAGI
jgi:hypothetical protein